MYQTGIAVTAAKKSLLKAADRNPEGIPKELYKCPYYHPLYCTVLGHTSCANMFCGMKHKTKPERDVALKVILSEAVNTGFDRSAAISEFSFKSRNPIYICSFHFHISKFVVFLPFDNRLEKQASRMDRKFGLRSGHIKDGELLTKKKKERKPKNR